MENFKKIDSKIDLIRTQEDILAYWKKNKIFEKSMAKGNKTAVFYDGPPFPTGKPHHGTLMMSLVKDLIARQKTMTGLSVPRTWGWDCHGLPLETMAESELGISGKADIEKFGIGKFNDKCKSIVTGATETWRPYVEKAARWCEYDNAYMTLKTDYMESVLWAFKTAYNKGLIYKDYRVTPYCWRCETGLSVSDTRESDSTREKQDPWVIVKFKSTLPDTYFLAWTTTPWTLISNTALAVNPEMDYGFYKVGNETFIASVGAQSRYEKIFGKVEPIKVVKGKELVGLTYEPVFDYYKKLFSVSPNRAWRVIVADHVDDTSGVGIVHMAPAFGEEDFIAAKKADIGLVNPVDAKGRFDKKISDFAGRQVQEANQDIIRHLKKEGKHVADGTLVHNYPHCWRCREPLIYRAIDAWYFAVTKIKKDLLKQADKITWVPETIKEGRFGNW
ncbi:MAG: class I tRNA ligase family protein, partial [Firmicutes bacterium]|nr:class I tRNA ligase family protein [Bacillota bacterium]